jgi:endonuclease YncB( thermonuclease family)
MPPPTPAAPASSREERVGEWIGLRPPYTFVDGRTLDAGNHRVAVSGVAAPGHDEICMARDGTPWACSALAIKAFEAIVRKRALRCKLDGQASERRVSGVCTVNGDDLAGQLVLSGWVRPISEHQFRAELGEAKQAKRGAWAWESPPPPGTVPYDSAIGFGAFEDKTDADAARCMPMRSGPHQGCRRSSDYDGVPLHRVSAHDRQRLFSERPVSV